MSSASPSSEGSWRHNGPSCSAVPTYEVVPAGPVARAVQNGTLPLHVVDILMNLVEGDLAEHPRRVGKPLNSPFDGKWSARIGDYRVIYTIDEQRKKITVTAVKRRADVYRPP